MHKSRFTDTQIVKTLLEVEGGRQVKEVSGEYRRSHTTYHNWKAKYRGVETLYVRRLKDIKEANRRLKQMYSGLSQALQDIVEKSSEASRQALAGRLRQRYI